MPARRQRGYAIRWAREAEGDLAYYTAAVQSAVRRSVPAHLEHDPLLDAGQRKLLDANPLDAPWRLRVGDYRIFYRVDEDAREVRILHVGYKPAETLFIRGKPVAMRVD